MVDDQIGEEGPAMKHLTTALLGSVFGLTATFAVQAADLPSRKAPVIVPPPLLTWDGFYFGLNAGYSWQQSNSVNAVGGPGAALLPAASATSALLSTFSLPVGSKGGFIGGGQTGYNKQFGAFVIGYESDIQGIASNRARVAAVSAAPILGVLDVQNAAVSKQINWLSTSRLRLGYLVTPTLLLYGTGGVAMGGVNASTGITHFVPAVPAIVPGAGFGSYSQTRVGYTVGGGAEWMFLPNWSVKAEYLYYDLGRANYLATPVTSTIVGIPLGQSSALSSTRFNGQIARIGVNYHWDWTGLFRAPATAISGGLPSFKGPAALPILAWDGFHIGLNAGYTWQQNTSVNSVGAPLPALVPSGPAAALATFNLSGGSKGGFIGGGQAGYDNQFGAFVVGWETDMQAIGSNRSTVSGVGAQPILALNQIATVSKKVDWLSTSRGRIGYLVTPTFLLYATGGAATGGVKTATSITQRIGPFAPGSGIGSYSQTRVGYTVGGGAEWMVTPNWSVKGEYLYYDLGRASYLVSPVTSTIVGLPIQSASALASTRFNGHVVRAGVNYHWNWDVPAAVVAKY
jgi:outer membrane immunogenic protein